MEEEWRPIDGYEGYYEISNLGNVRSLDRFIFFKDGRIRKFKGQAVRAWRNRYGYMCATIQINKRQRNYYIHRLVANAFLGEHPNEYEVNHIDENKENNRVDNLEWVSHDYNMKFGTRYARQIQKQEKTQFIAVVQMSLDNTPIREYISITEASKATHTDISHIARCCRGIKGNVTCGGYKWKFKDDR